MGNNVRGGSNVNVATTFGERVEKFNPYHDRLGRFSSAGGAASFTFRTKDPSKQKYVDAAIARERERAKTAAGGAAGQSPNSAIKDTDEPVHIYASFRRGRNTMFGASYRTQSVLEAKETSDGVLELDYATPTKTDYRKNGNIDYEYDLKCGLYQSSNRSGINSSVNIDWDKVQSVSGRTYESQSFLREKGLKWDSEKKIYTRNPTQPKNSTSNGVLNIARGGKLPSDLSGITAISGDTYANRSQIKAAGFKWNPDSKMWVKPGVQKSSVMLLDDEPAPEYSTARTFANR